FGDMSHIYDEELITMIRDTARELDIQLKEGVYVQLTGPAYESPQEVKMCRVLGGDAVGMSTACEAVAANHMGMRICGISCISNLACGMTDVPLSHEEVQETSDRVAPLFKKLVWESIGRMGIS
ncbi:MAG: purine-nucleoside phosphorylase, partial [Clostridium sp.]|nr:purine-nucleoside phosphorylase [Clostridium sp.]